MKYSVLFCGFLSLALISCNGKTDGSDTLESITKSTVDEIVDQNYDLQFKDIVVSQGLKVDVYRASTSRVEVKAPKSIASQLIVQTEGDKVMIHCKAGATASAMQSAQIKVYLPDIGNLEATNAAEIHLKDKFVREKILVRAISGAHITGSLMVENLEIDAGSSAEVDMEIYSDNLKLICSSGSTMKLKGEVTLANVEASSSATIEGENLSVKELELSAVSAARVVLQNHKRLKATASSGARVDIKSSQDLVVEQQDANSGSHITVHKVL